MLLMINGIGFILTSVLFGVGLAMDAFSVSAANGLSEPCMTRLKMCKIAGTFGIFQFIMPLIGWFCVHTISNAFAAFQPFIPWIALLLLLYIGGNMLKEGIKSGDDYVCDIEAANNIDVKALMLQGIATSIDALSVGFTIASYTFAAAAIESLIIGVVTFIICIAGLILGKTLGTKLAGKAQILGGVILILIGIRIFFTA